MFPRIITIGRILGIALIALVPNFSFAVDIKNPPFYDTEPFVLTRGYNTPDTHIGKDKYALDFAQNGCSAFLKPVIAVSDGEIISVNTSTAEGLRSGGGFGIFVLLKHSDGTQSRYAHLNEIFVSSGKIKSGQLIGLIGNTGNVNRESKSCLEHPGTHLHFVMYNPDLSSYKPEPIALCEDVTVNTKPCENFTVRHKYKSEQKIAKEYEKMPKIVAEVSVPDTAETIETTTNFWQNFSNSVYNFFANVDNPVFVAGERFGEALWEAAGEGNNQASAALIFSPPTIEPLNLELLNIEPETPDRELLSAEPLNLEPETFDTALETSDIELKNTEPADAVPAVPETPKDFSETPVAVVTGYGNYGPTGPNGSAAPIEAIVPVPPACAAFKAEYFANLTLAGEPALVQCETEIKHNWQQGSPHELLPADDFSVRWSGSFLFEDAVYQFLLITDDGSRIFVDDVNILNAWFNQPSNMYFVNVPMTAGMHTIRIEYYEHTVFASFTARWLKL